MTNFENILIRIVASKRGWDITTTKTKIYRAQRLLNLGRGEALAFIGLVYVTRRLKEKHYHD